jgi:hypothetical protein
MTPQRWSRMKETARMLTKFDGLTDQALSVSADAGACTLARTSC